MLGRFPDADIVFIESDGDKYGNHLQPRAVESDDLRDRRGRRQKNLRKGGPGITKSDLLVINKNDLAPLVGAIFEIMALDTRKMGGERQYVMTNLKSLEGVAKVIPS